MKRWKFNNRIIKLANEKKIITPVFLLTIILLISAGTYAFTSYTEWVKNHFQSNGEALDVRIVELFDQKTLSPKVVVKKEVKVRNTSSTAGLIRVKLDESFLPFEVNLQDKTGNANMRTTTTKSTMVNQEDTSTWSVGNTFDSGLKDGNSPLYYIATNPSNTLALNDVLNQPISFDSGTTPVRTDFFNDFVSVTFNSNVFGTFSSSRTGDYWLYEDGYFYYSRPLEGEELTPVNLIESITATSQMSNFYKEALYKMNVTAEGVYANEASLSSWKNSGPVYSMLVGQLKN